MSVIMIDTIEFEIQEHKDRSVQELAETMLRVIGDRSTDMRIIKQPSDNLATAIKLLSEDPMEGRS